MPCEVVPAGVWPDKDPDSALDHYVDFETECARRWEQSTDFGASVRIREGGFDWESSGGRSRGRGRTTFPEVATADVTTVTDGSITWTCKALSTSSLKKTISGTPTWVADTGITTASAAIVGTRASAVLSGGVDGQDYTVLVNAIFSDDTTLTKVCILPVRRAVRVCS